MNRRKFCKIVGLSVVAAALSPVSVSAVASVRRCRITVIRRECFIDLQSRYLDDPEAGPCERFACGDEMVVDASNYGDFASGRKFCPRAWSAIQGAVDRVLAGDVSDACGESLHDGASIICCPDGTRPVVFKVTPF